MRTIELTQDQITRVDDKDYERFNQDKWQAAWDPATKSFYAQRSVRRDGKKTTLFAHREIMGIEPGDPRHVHHKDHDTLNNTRSNLKVVTRLEHKNEHRNDPRKDASPHGIGVQRRKNGRFQARAQIDGKKHCVGTFDTPEEAQAARAAFLAKGVD